MASISTDSKGNRCVQFVAADGKRRSVRLGKVSMRQAETIRLRIEALNSAIITGQAPDGDTSAWLASRGDDLHAKLSAVGLATPRQSGRLGAFLTDFIDKQQRAGAKPNTVKNLIVVSRRMTEHFGDDCDLRSITEGDADGFLQWMQEKQYAQATIGRCVKRARQFFKAALRGKLVVNNPFAEVKAASNPDKSRQAFISLDTIARVIDAAPDYEWRLLIALSRYGGLRCPSEHLGLRWSDIAWDRDRFLVHAPKQEHLTTGGDRWVPIFPELRPFLQEAFERAEDGAEFVITRYRDTSCNLRTQLARIIKRAGCLAWPKPFHNLRASRETELAASFPIHVVCSWLGNTEAIAAKHYLQVRDEDFSRAAKSGAVAVHIPVQSTHTLQKSTEDTSAEVLAAVPCRPLEASLDSCRENHPIPPRGLEPNDVSSNIITTLCQSPSPSAAHIGAGSAEQPQYDTDIFCLIAAWPSLSEAARLSIKKAIRSILDGAAD